MVCVWLRRINVKHFEHAHHCFFLAVREISDHEDTHMEGSLCSRWRFMTGAEGWGWLDE